MFYVLLYVTLFHSSIAIILMGKRELVALLNLFFLCLAVQWGCLWFVIVVFSDHTHLFFCKAFSKFYYRHSALIVKYNSCLKTLLQQGISQPEFYGDIVYKSKIII